MASENETQGDDVAKAIQDIERAEGNLKRAEEEIREASEELEAAREEHRRTITIIVDGTDYQVRSGEWFVHDLKSYLNIDPASVLAEITPQGLKDMDDNAEIELHDKERFMTHARSGGSS